MHIICHVNRQHCKSRVNTIIYNSILGLTLLGIMTWKNMADLLEICLFSFKVILDKFKKRLLPGEIWRKFWILFENFWKAPNDHCTVHFRGNSEVVGGLLANFIIKYPFSTYSGPDGESQTVKEVTLENNLTGSVIGDKGSRIRDVRATSGARIRIG